MQHVLCKQILYFFLLREKNPDSCYTNLTGLRLCRGIVVFVLICWDKLQLSSQRKKHRV